VDITLDGTYALRALLEGIGGEVFATEHDRIRHELWEHDWRQARADHGDQARPEHLTRTEAQRGADALVEMARRAAASRAAGTSGTPPRPLITVLVDHETFTQRVCETARGVIVAPELLADALFEAEVERVVFEPANRTMHIGRKARFFRGALRRCIEIRDRWCTHPGCRVPADQCDIDHITPWNRGGRTSLDNGRLLCGPHNRHAYQRQHQHPGPSPPAAA
ncbi:MAG: HNH endonuclease, partial [Actinobacteria bacterium]|nr:HNH endonuclease [Actinomycetota bacterium]